jgi:hypothetical protein
MNIHNLTPASTVTIGRIYLAKVGRAKGRFLLVRVLRSEVSSFVPAGYDNVYYCCERLDDNAPTARLQINNLYEVGQDLPKGARDRGWTLENVARSNERNA